MVVISSPMFSYSEPDSVSDTETLIFPDYVHQGRATPNNFHTWDFPISARTKIGEGVISYELRCCEKNLLWVLYQMR